MAKYLIIVKRVITPEVFARQTGIDLSHTDMTKIKPVEVEEQIMIGDRSALFSALMKTIGPLGGSVQVLPS